MPSASLFPLLSRASPLASLVLSQALLRRPVAPYLPRAVFGSENEYLQHQLDKTHVAACRSIFEAYTGAPAWPARRWAQLRLTGQSAWWWGWTHLAAGQQVTQRALARQRTICRGLLQQQGIEEEQVHGP